MKLQLSKPATIDILEIFNYSVSEFGLDQAEKYYQLIFEAFDTLIDNPSAGHKRRDLQAPNLAFSVGQHIIIYKVDIKFNVLTILRLFHSRMDFSRRI